MSTSDAERKSLEVHVELSELRDKTRKEAYESLENKVKELTIALQDIKDLLADMKDERNKQLIKWGTAIIAAPCCKSRATPLL